MADSTERSGYDKAGQVQQALSMLARQGDLISMALEGNIELGERSRHKAIDDLVSIKALKPFDEGTYHLNPHLREFITDHLQSYNAYQNLTRIRERLYRARTLWTEIKSLRSSGDSAADVDRLEWILDYTINDISFATDSNLQLLNSKVSTQYGDVESLAAKISQNKFYAREVTFFLQELDQVGQMVTDIADDALVLGNARIRQMVNRRLGSRLLSWRSQLKDSQAVISKRLFWARKLEQRLQNLSRASLWLTQNKTREGLDVDLNESIPTALLRPIGLQVSPQLDVRDTDPVVTDGMAAAVSKLPPRPSTVEPSAERKPQVLKSDVSSNYIEIREPEEELIEVLMSELEAMGSGCKALSLADWLVSADPHATFTTEEWLLYASGQLAAMGYQVDMVRVPESPSEGLNRRFSDFLVSYAH